MSGIKGIIQIMLALGLAVNVKLDISDYKNVDKLLDMVVDNITFISKSQTALDSSAILNITNNQVSNYGTFDFIIVGGGAAGSVLANRLSEISNWNILLLEAGGNENDFNAIPEMFTYKSSEQVWGYNITSVSPPHGVIQRNYERGKVLGGSTVINAAIYARGNPEDYDSWQIPGWSFKEVLPYFKKSENVNFSGSDPEYHGFGGYWNVKHQPDFLKLKSMVVQPFEELGQKEILDYNGRNQIGISRVQLNHINNEKLSSAKAFLNTRVKSRSNLNIGLNAFATKLLFRNKNKIVHGVEFVMNKKKYTATCKKEIILSAGAVNTPQILMVSGIGPKLHLNALGINTIHDLPVGKSTSDHVFFARVYFRTNQTFYNVTFKDQAELYLQGKRPWTSTMHYVNFLKLNNLAGDLRPDIEILFGVLPPFYADYPDNNKTEGYSNETFGDIALYIALMNPKSKGKDFLQSKNLKDFPIINPNYYGDKKQSDLETMYQALLYLEKLNKTKAFKENGISLYYPEMPPCDSLYLRYCEKWYKCILVGNIVPGLHLVGSTPMGLSQNVSVVDPNLKVYGIQNLRVVDAGVMPNVNSGHTAAPTMMIAEKAADIIKKEFNRVFCKKN